MEFPMPAPGKPDNEAVRLKNLHSLKLLDTAPEERFDRLTRLARRLFDVPIALVSLVDAHRQWFKSNAGLHASESGRDVSFCGHAILPDQIMEVCDAQPDDRFRDNTFVPAEPGLRFYAGHPLGRDEARPMGTWCLGKTR